MPIDPKYADLPMIAKDEKDIYETDDLPEVDQTIKNTDDTSIEKIVISHDKAKDAFNDKVVDSTNTDFSDAIKPYFNTGYSVETNEYVLYPSNDRQKETPIQKFQRLQNEVRELELDVTAVKKLSKLDVEKLQSSKDLVDIDRDLGQILNQVRQFNLHTLLGSKQSDVADLDDDLCDNETKKMLDHLKTTIAQQKSSKSDPTISLERFYTNPLNKEMDSAKLTNLQQRLLKLEAVLGTEDCQTGLNFTQLTTSAPCKTLVQSTKQLSSRCQPLLGGANVDKIDSRLIGLQSKLATLTEKNQLIKEADKQNKIAELHNLIEKWILFQQHTEFIVERLKQLQQLHKHALVLNETLGHIDSSQKQMHSNFVEYSKQLQLLEKQFIGKLGIITSTMSAMQKKIESL